MSTIEKKLVLFFGNLKFIDGQMLTVTYKFTAMPNAECRMPITKLLFMSCNENLVDI